MYIITLFKYGRFYIQFAQCFYEFSIGLGIGKRGNERGIAIKLGFWDISFIMKGLQ